MIFYLLFSMTSFLFSSNQRTCETSWSYLGNLHKPSYKTNIYGNNSVASAINAWNITHRSFWKFLSDIYLLIKFKKNGCFFCKVLKWIVNFQIFQNDGWWFFKFCKLYISFNFFSLLLLFYNMHFTIWFAFDILD